MSESQEARPKQCTASTERTGERCKQNAVAGTEYCPTHLDFAALSEGEVRCQDFSQSDAAASTAADTVASASEAAAVHRETDAVTDDSTDDEVDADDEEEPEPADDHDPRDRLPEPECEPADELSLPSEPVLKDQLVRAINRFRGAGVSVETLTATPEQSRVRLETSAGDLDELIGLTSEILRGWWSAVHSCGVEWAVEFQTVIATPEVEATEEECLTYTIAAEWLPNSADETDAWEAVYDHVEADLRDEYGIDANLPLTANNVHT